MKRVFELKIEEREKGQWVVWNPEGRPERGVDVVEWTLSANKDDPISAHFQFLEEDLVEDEAGQGQLTRDLTANIPAPGKKLRLKVQADADRRRNPHRYAVWVQDNRPGHGSVFAVGADLNPPPEINVGP